MTDLFSYHLAKQQLADLRRTAGETQLRATRSSHRVLTSSRKLVTSLFTYTSTLRKPRRRPPRHRISRAGK
jgi:hypothetical protein